MRMTIRIVAVVNVETRPGKIDIALILRLRRVVDHDSGLVFKGRDAVFMIDGGHRVSPAQAAINRCFDQHPTLGPAWPGHANTFEREMNVISGAVISEVDHVVTLGKV